jgi:hypothetical protein
MEDGILKFKEKPCEVCPECNLSLMRADEATWD